MLEDRAEESNESLGILTGEKTEILQQRNYWEEEEEEDLQSVFHIDDNGQSQEHGASASAQSFHGW